MSNLNGELVGIDELVKLIVASRNVEFRLFVASLDGFVGVSKKELSTSLRLFVGPDHCDRFTVHKSEYWDGGRTVWRIQGVPLPYEPFH